MSECSGDVSVQQVRPERGASVAGEWDRDSQQLKANLEPEVRDAVVRDLVEAGR